jgi:E3 ubiquitin-protein ligase HERC4
MGSKVIQIACGRQHTLALVKSSGRVYSWGLGGSGQLGLASTRNFNSPSAIASFEWTSANSSIGCVVKQIFAGGDQSFVCIPSEQCLPLDFRESNPCITPSFLSQESLQQAIYRAQQLHNFADLLRKLDSVLRSPSLINGSFLASDGADSTMQFGVDMESVRLSFKSLDSINMQEIKQQVYPYICFENPKWDVVMLCFLMLD